MEGTLARARLSVPTPASSGHHAKGMVHPFGIKIGVPQNSVGDEYRRRRPRRT